MAGVLFLVLNKANPKQAQFTSIVHYWDLYADDAQLRKKLQLAMADDIDTAFEGLAASFDKHVRGADPVIQLRRSRFDAYRKDPRYLRLLNKAGFDDEGKIR